MSKSHKTKSTPGGKPKHSHVPLKDTVPPLKGGNNSDKLDFPFSGIVGRFTAGPWSAGDNVFTNRLEDLPAGTSNADCVVLNPTLLGNAPLATEAGMWSRYKFSKLVVTVQGLAGELQPGAVSALFVADPDEPIVYDGQLPAACSQAARSNNVMVRVYDRGEFSPALPPQPTPLFVEEEVLDTSQPVDAHETQQGKIVFCATEDTPEEAAGKGNVWISGVCHFSGRYDTTQDLVAGGESTAARIGNAGQRSAGSGVSSFWVGAYTAAKMNTDFVHTDLPFSVAADGTVRVYGVSAGEVVSVGINAIARASATAAVVWQCYSTLAAGVTATVVDSHNVQINSVTSGTSYTLLGYAIWRFTKVLYDEVLRLPYVAFTPSVSASASIDQVSVTEMLLSVLPTWPGTLNQAHAMMRRGRVLRRLRAKRGAAWPDGAVSVGGPRGFWQVAPTRSNPLGDPYLSGRAPTSRLGSALWALQAQLGSQPAIASTAECPETPPPTADPAQPPVLVRGDRLTALRAQESIAVLDDIEDLPVKRRVSDWLEGREDCLDAEAAAALARAVNGQPREARRRLWPDLHVLPQSPTDAPKCAAEGRQ